MTVSDRTLVDETSSVLIVGYGLHGQAIADALDARDVAFSVVDDRPSEAAREHAATAGRDLLIAPTDADIDGAVAIATHVVPTPGLPHHHRLFVAAPAAGVPIISEFDLAAQWDHRPVVAITGTNGKTTVTTMVTDMLCASGMRASMAGNMEVPLVTAIEDPGPEVFVVEASSFRLAHAHRFAPVVAAWLNLQPDHLDVHASMEEYEAAKARIWSGQGARGVAVGNAEDPAVMRNLPGRASDITFGLSAGHATLIDGDLVVGAHRICGVSDLARNLPHDVANALAASATALAAGADVEAVRSVLESFAGLEHRVQLVAEHRGVRWFDDSKATTPHAVQAGVGGFDSAVLIAGGRNKGVDLAPLAELAPHLRGVVAIGEAADEVAAVFQGVTRVRTALSMGDAVAAAAALAEPGDAVVLSPACTSYDWYENYGARGEDFARLVRRYVDEGEAVEEVAGR